MSMSRKGTPADNAPIESFHSVLKSETFYLDNLKNTTTAIVEQTVKDYINYYNNNQIQTKRNNQSPVQYRQLVGCCFLIAVLYTVVLFIIQLHNQSVVQCFGKPYALLLQLLFKIILCNNWLTV